MMNIKVSLSISFILHTFLIALLSKEIKKDKAKTSMIELNIISYQSTKNEGILNKGFDQRDVKNTKKKTKEALTISNYNIRNNLLFNSNPDEVKSNSNTDKKDEFDYIFKNNKNNQFYKAQYQLGTKNNPSPPYPLLARKKGWEGTVILIVMVNEDGSVKEVNVEKSTGFHILDLASLQTIKKWFFIPAKKGKKNVKDTIKIPVRFTLN